MYKKYSMARPKAEIPSRRETKRFRFVPVSADIFKTEPTTPIRIQRHAQHRLLDQATVFTPTEDLPEQLGITELKDRVKKPELTNSNPTESKKNLPLGDRRRMVILGLMRLNATQTGPEFYGYSDLRLIEDVYGEKILDSKGNKSPAKIRNLRGATFQARNAFIDVLENPERQTQEVKTRTKALLEEIKKLYPYYRDLTIPQIVGLLKRTIDFSEVIKPVTIPVEEVLPDGFVVRKRTYLPSIEAKPQPVSNNGRLPERSHFPPKRRKPRKMLQESTKLSEEVFPRFPKTLHTMTQEEIVAYSLMLVKDDGRNFRYPNAIAAVLNIYDDPIAGVHKLSKRSRASIKIPSAEEADAILATFISKLREYDLDEEVDYDGKYKTSNIVHNFVNWADKQPLYEGSTIENLIEVLSRHISFGAVLDLYSKRRYVLSLKPTGGSLEAVTKEHKLSLEGKYLIANVLWDMSPSRLASFGISISEESEITISTVIDAFEAQHHKDNSLIEAIGPAVNMLRELFKDREALVKRVRDPETKRILLTLDTLRPSRRDELIKLLLSSG